MTTTKTGIDLIKEFEGCSLVAYPDPLTGKEPITIGWGSTRRLNGTPFKLGDRISQSEADLLLDSTVESAIIPEMRKIPYWPEMAEEQQGALVSFAYNLGTYFYGSDGFETISRRLRNKEWKEVPSALMLYVNPGTSVEAGLRRRRTAEGDAWTKGMSGPKVIVAKQNTYLKKEPRQAAELTSDKKKSVVAGKEYSVLSLVKEGTHSKVELAYSAGTWYIFNDHWDIK